MFDPKEKLPAGSIIYVGRRKLRHFDELEDIRANHGKDVKLQLLIEEYPSQVPHVFIDFSGLTYEKALASGGDSVVIQYQKLCRDKVTLNQLNVWRERMFEAGMDYSDDRVPPEDYLIVLSAKNINLDVPLQPEDKLQIIKDKAPKVYDALLAGLDEEDKLKEASDVYDSLKAMLG